MKRLILFTLLCMTGLSLSAQNNDTTALEVFEVDSLLEQLEESGRPYLPFLDRSTLKCGIYTLKAGATDHQQPHTLDEVYYVLDGTAMFTVEGEDIAVKKGDVLFVKAHAEHRFHTIVNDLKLLVFFSTAKEE